MNDIVPRSRYGAPERWNGDNPFLALHRQMNRLFDDTFRNVGVPMSSDTMSWPSLEVSNTEKEVTVTADLPGLDEKDIDLQVEDNVLTLKGETRAETSDKERQYSERYYGRFERRIALPAEVDEQQAKATFRNGVLKVMLPKTDRGRESSKHIPITRM